ncbi:MAG: M23 family metallopeptidase [Erysipelotrichia bacterium]|nr:M23 family metallopeptidase [Erysipelotrichia bacterium]
MNYFTWLLSVVFLFNPLITIAEEVIWPLKIDISQSSSFAEFRGMRFHAGLDLRTQQKNGFPVVAIADGFISRASVQFRGYGYALYIDHPGLKARVVYGHLQDFSGPIKEYIDHKLKKMGKRHGINDFFQSDRFPVKKGQIVALSGDSGMGPPHLHFEMRSLADEPVAPAVFGFRPADNIFPTFHSFYLEPMAHATVIDGSFLSSRYPLKKAGRGVYSLVSTPQVSGRFAMQVGISDTNGAGNRFGVEKVTLSVNDRQILQRIFHKYTYDENRQCPWVYDYFKSNQKNMGYVYNLFKWPFDTLHLSSENANWSGFLPDSDFKAGKFDFIVAAADFGNNAIKASGSLATGKTDFSQQISAEQLVDFDFSEVVQTHFSAIAIGTRKKTASALMPVTGKIACKDAAGKIGELEAILKPGRVEIAFSHDKRWQGGAWLGDRRILPETILIDAKGGEVVSEDGAKVCFPKNSLHFAAFVAMRKVDLAPIPGGNAKRGFLKPYSPIWKLTPDNQVFDAEARVEIRPESCTGNMQKLGVYNVSSTGGYSHNGERIENGACVFSTRTGGRYVILEDLLPPIMSYKKQITDYHLGKCYVFEVSDLGKGVDYLSATAEIDGSEAEVYSDPDKSEVYVVKPQKAGLHKINLKINDQAGNTASITIAR